MPEGMIRPFKYVRKGRDSETRILYGLLAVTGCGSEQGMYTQPVPGMGRFHTQRSKLIESKFISMQPEYPGYAVPGMCYIIVFAARSSAMMSPRTTGTTIV